MNTQASIMPRAPIVMCVAGVLCSACGAKFPTNGRPAAAVSFTTSIASTRAFDNVWEGGDLVGIYMVPARTGEAAYSPHSAADWQLLEEERISANMKYGTDLDAGETGGKVTFSGVDERNTLLWPKDGGAVDFVAYYPWLGEGIEDFTLPVDVRVQNPQRKIDLMWSNNARGQSSTSHDTSLSFSHRLTKLIFNVTDLAGGSLRGMRVTVGGLPSTARFDLAAGRIVAGSEAAGDEFEAPVVSTFDADGDPRGVAEQAVAEAIVLPGAGLDYAVGFELESGEKALFELKGVTYAAGKRYIYNLELVDGDRGVRFVGVDGALESITQWEEVADGGKYELPKDNGGFGGAPSGGKGAAWTSGTISAASRGFTVSGGTYDATRGYMVRQGEKLAIVKDDYDGGVESIAVVVSRSFGTVAKISAVTVDGEAMVVVKGGVASTETSAEITADGSVLFVATNGKLLSGVIRITGECSSGNLYLNGFAVN